MPNFKNAASALRGVRTILSFVLIFNCFSQAITAQSLYDSTNYVPFDYTISILKQKHHVRLFYDPASIKPKRIHKSILNESFESALGKLSEITGLSPIKVSKRSYVFLPYEAQIQSSVYDLVTIGNYLDYGKYSTAIIEGNVLDGKTGELISGALVTDVNSNLTVNTDKNGKFVLKLSVGDHELKTKFIGYEEITTKIRVYGKGTLSIELFQKSINLEEIIVRAQMDQFNSNRNQMSMVRIDAKGIKELPVSMGEKDIIKSVTLIPGVQSAGEFGTGFNVRGGSTDQNLVLIEDLPVFNPSHVFGLISIVNPDDVASVTLLKAGIPAKYGEKASSVLDIRMGTNQPDKISIKGGIGLINSRLSVNTPVWKKKLTLKLSSRSSYSDWLLHQIPDADLHKSNAGFNDFNGMLVFSPNTLNRISLFGYESNDNFKFANTTQYTYSNKIAGIKWFHVFGNSFTSMAILGKSVYNLSVEEDIDKPLESSKIDLGINYSCFKWNLNFTGFNKNTIDFGVNAMHYINNPGKFKSVNDSSLVMHPERGAEFSGYISDIIDFTTNFTIEAGFRFTRYLFLGPNIARYYLPERPRVIENLEETRNFNKNDAIYSYNGYEPRLSFTYRINSDNSIRASYSKIHQFMNLVSNSSIMAPTDIWKLNDNNLPPLICKQYAIGYYRNFVKRSLDFSIEIYYKNLENQFEYKDGARLLLNDKIETALINSHGNNYGLELYLKRNTGKLTGWVSYTLSRSEKKTTSNYSEDQLLNNRTYLSGYDRPHNLTIMGNYHLSRRWRLSGTFTYLSGRPVTLPEKKYYIMGNQLIYYSDRNKYRLPEYHRLDLSITLDESLKIRKKWKGSWTFSIVNLYARKNAFSAYYKKDIPSPSNNYRTFSEYTLYIIGKPFPTLTYNFFF